MGNATTAPVQLRSRAHTERLHCLYQSYQFNSLKKSPARFRVEVRAIRRKCSYLPYNWAKQLEHLLTAAPSDDLYEQYLAVLKENCRREGKREKIFCSADVRKSFSEEFVGRYLVSSEKLTSQQLQAAFQESKCYLMVLSWLHSLATIQSSENELSEVNQLLRQPLENSQLAEEAIIYEMLVKLSLHNYAESSQRPTSHDENVSNISSSSKLVHFKDDLAMIVRKLNKRCHFFEKERLMGQLQELLMADREDLEDNVRLVMEYLGRENIVAQLHTIQEVGSLKVNFLWQQFSINQTA